MASSCDCCWLIHCEQNPNGELHMLSFSCLYTDAEVKLVFFLFFLKMAVFDAI